MKQKILELAERLLLLRGYNAFSYKDISSELDIKNAAVHYHYPKKKDLGIALVHSISARFKKWIAETESQVESPKQRLENFCEAYWRLCSKEGQENMCIIGSLLADYHTLPEDMVQCVEKHTDSVITWIDKTLAAGREQQEFHFTENSRDKAIVMIAALQGVLKLTRIYGNDLYKKTCDDLLNNLLHSSKN